jgi:hypothetical protein
MACPVSGRCYVRARPLTAPRPLRDQQHPISQPASPQLPAPASPSHVQMVAGAQPLQRGAAASGWQTPASTSGRPCAQRWPGSRLRGAAQLVTVSETRTREAVSCAAVSPGGDVPESQSRQGEPSSSGSFPGRAGPEGEPSLVRVRLSVHYRVHSRQMLCIGGSQIPFGWSFLSIAKVPMMWTEGDLWTTEVSSSRNV